MEDKYTMSYENINIKLSNVEPYWGELMPLMAIEEMSELMQAISKYERKGVYRKDNLIEEIGDTYIALYSLMKHYQIDVCDVENYMNEKLKRSKGPEKLKETIYSKTDKATATRIYNALLRNNISNEERVRFMVNNVPNWYRAIKGMGKTNAEKLEEIYKS